MTNYTEILVKNKNEFITLLQDQLKQKSLEQLEVQKQIIGSKIIENLPKNS